jgi:hypothetical protein
MLLDERLVVERSASDVGPATSNFSHLDGLRLSRLVMARAFLGTCGSIPARFEGKMFEESSLPLPLTGPLIPLLPQHLG